MNVKNIRRLVSLCSLLLLSACDPSPGPPASQGFAGLGASASAYAQVTPGKRLIFPEDHGAHPDYRIEWWYVTADLKDAQGRSWGVQWTLFRSALQPQGKLTGWSKPTVWMGHAGLTGPYGQRFAQALARGGVGQAGAQGQPFEAWIDDWQLRSLSAANDGLADLQMNAHGGGFAYQLHLHSDKPLVLQGDHGYSLKSGKGQASYYYSQPFFQASGSLELDGQTYQVQGPAWLDREWSSQPLAADQKGWDWLSLHLANGDKLMVFQLRHDDGQHYRAGTWINADGTTDVLSSDDIVLTPGRQSQVAGRPLPVEWRVQVLSHHLDIQTRPVRDDAWMGTAFPYWEGPISFTGSQAGVGYLEMTGY